MGGEAFVKLKEATFVPAFICDSSSKRKGKPSFVKSGLFELYMAFMPEGKLKLTVFNSSEDEFIEALLLWGADELSEDLSAKLKLEQEQRNKSDIKWINTEII